MEGEQIRPGRGRGTVTLKLVVTLIKRVHHSAKVYVIGDAHTNTIEGFWSLVKNGIRSVYHNVGSQYLQTYFDEYAFRYNRRMDARPMFHHFLTQIQKDGEKPS